MVFCYDEARISEDVSVGQSVRGSVRNDFAFQSTRSDLYTALLASYFCHAEKLCRRLVKAGTQLGLAGLVSTPFFQDFFSMALEHRSYRFVVTIDTEPIGIFLLTMPYQR